MDGTIIQQGRFTSNGSAKTLQIRSDVDWMKVLNYTVASNSQTTAVGVQYYWQRGMATDTGIEYLKSNAANAANLTTALTSGGFTLVDSSASSVGTLNTTITAISNASTPVVSASSTAGLSNGSIVRMINVAGAQQLGGIDFTVGSVTTNTSFTLAYMSQIAAGTTGSFRVISFDPIYYPRRRFISAITKASSAVVTLTVTHGYTVGQQVRFVVPDAYGMTQIDGLTGTITAINTTNNTITVNIDSSAFTTFAFPTTTAVPFTPAQVVPVGEDTATALSNSVDILGDSTLNTGYIGMILAAGANSPAGQNNDVIYWVAGKSFNIDNQ